MWLMRKLNVAETSINLQFCVFMLFYATFTVNKFVASDCRAQSWTNKLWQVIRSQSPDEKYDEFIVVDRTLFNAPSFANEMKRSLAASNETKYRDKYRHNAIWRSFQDLTFLFLYTIPSRYNTNNRKLLSSIRQKVENEVHAASSVGLSALHALPRPSQTFSFFH